MKRLLATCVLVATFAGVLSPFTALAQVPACRDSAGTVEIGFLHEWFHRELEPSLYADTRWSVTSLRLSYAVSQRAGLELQGGLSGFDNQDFPGSDFIRYAVGGGVSFAILHRGRWDAGVNGRYLEIFDFDDSKTALHKRVQSLYVAATVSRYFDVWHAPAVVFVGPVYADDRVQTYAWDSREPLESDSGGAVGAEVGARFVLMKFVSLFGYANYLEQVQGGVGVSLHASRGGF